MKTQASKRGTKSSTAKTPESGSSEAECRVLRLFRSLDHGGKGVLSAAHLTGALEEVGLRLDDPRLADSMTVLRREVAGGNGSLDSGAFERIVQPAAVLIERALQGDLVVPDFQGFCADLDENYDRAEKNHGGAVANYIPQLGRVDANQFGVGVCTIDGQRYARGEADVEFCVQSCCKPINYCLALEEHGEEKVHKHIGREPSGQRFNKLALNEDGLPHNPLINAGAIAACGLIRPKATCADRFDHVLETWRRLTGGKKPGFSNPTYLSERRTADRNFALGYFMRESGSFPAEADLVETLEFYFQCCSLEATAASMSVLAATLAGGGVCPITGEQVFSPSTVQKCLTLMYSCGMYDFSGEWAFCVGLPAKSGVSGAVLVVVPNVLGICIWSPRLDRLGNSVRGVDFSRYLTQTFNFHNYDNLVGGRHDKKDPRQGRNEARRQASVDLCWAASEGDLKGLQRLLASGVDPNLGDYDGRTALHLAASEGRLQAVEYLLAQGAEASPLDRWGGTPLDDARKAGHEQVATVLAKAAG